MKRLVLFLIFIMLIFVFGLYAYDEKQYDYAQSLYNDSDYYRAIGEYKKYIYYNEKGNHAEQASYMIGIAYMGAGKFDEAIDRFEKLESKYTGKIQELSIIAKGQSYNEKQDYVFSNSVVEKFISDYPNSVLKDKALYLKGWNDFYMNKLDDSRLAFESVKIEGQIKNSALSMIETISKRGNIENRSSILAAIFSAIIPGSGHIYCGRWADGLVAMFIEGFFIYQTHTAFQRNDVAGKFGYGLPALVFYSSSIYGAVAAADKFNEDELAKYIHSAESFKVDIISTDF